MSSAVAARQVSYWARHHQMRGVWQAALPARCWRCLATQPLSQVTYDFQVRSFDNALGVLVGTLVTSLLTLTAAAMLHSYLLTWLTVIFWLLCPIMLWLRSFPEAIEIVVSTCPTHAHDVDRPAAVVDDLHLHLFLANAELAHLTREALLYERRHWTPSHAGEGREEITAAPAPARAGEPNAPPPPPPRRAPSAELPPIRLSDDE